MVRLMHKKYIKFLVMKHSVLLFINLALFFVVFFTKIVSTLYTGLYISFLFSHINITHPKKWYHYLKWKTNTGKKANVQKKLGKVVGPKYGFLHKPKAQWKEWKSWIDFRNGLRGLQNKLLKEKPQTLPFTN